MQFWPIPYQRLDLQSSLSPAVVHDRLRELIGPTEAIRMQWGEPEVTEGKPLMGNLDANGFKAVLRSTTAKNSFVPVVIGRLSASMQGTRIELKLRLQAFVALFIPIWMGVAIYFGVLRARPQVDGAQPVHAGMGIPLVMVGIAYGMTVICFAWEARRARLLLTKTLECS